MKPKSTSPTESILWDDSRPVTAILSRGRVISPEKCDRPVCGDCGGSRGYQVRHTKQWIWCGSLDRCIRQNIVPKTWTESEV